MSLEELGSATPVGERLAAINRVLPHEVKDPVCYLKEADVKKKKHGVIAKLRSMFKKDPERSFVAISAEPDALGIPLLAVSVEAHNGDEAHVDIHAMKETARQDPGLVKGVVQLAMEQCHVTTGIISEGSADLPEDVMQRAFEPMKPGSYAVHATIAA